jgi:hypothetical protein
MTTTRKETADAVHAVADARGATVRDAYIKLLLGIVFLLIGGYVVKLAIEMVSIFGEGLGVDQASREIYAHAHVAVHIFGTASALAVGWFIRAKLRWQAVLAVTAILLCGGYGVVNMIGFTTTNRLSVSESRSAASAADLKKYENARVDLQAQIKWLEGSVVDASPREARRLYAEINAKRKELSAIEPPRPTAASVLADPQATWFSRMTNLSAESWQLALPVPVAFLLFIAEVLSFIFATYLIAVALERLRSQRSPSGDGGGGSNDHPSVKQWRRHQHQISKPEAFADLQGLTAHGRQVPTQEALCKRWNLPKQTVSYWLKGWEEQGLFSREWHGKTRATAGVRNGPSTAPFESRSRLD